MYKFKPTFWVYEKKENDSCSCDEMIFSIIWSSSGLLARLIQMLLFIFYKLLLILSFIEIKQPPIFKICRKCNCMLKKIAKI